jgi:hypothetical protein
MKLWNTLKQMYSFKKTAFSHMKRKGYYTEVAECMDIHLYKKVNLLKYFTVM